jgi:hypothetical protein
MTRYEYALKEYGDALIAYYKSKHVAEYNHMCYWQEELARIARFIAEE